MIIKNRAKFYSEYTTSYRKHLKRANAESNQDSNEQLCKTLIQAFEFSEQENVKIGINKKNGVNCLLSAFMGNLDEFFSENEKQNLIGFYDNQTKDSERNLLTTLYNRFHAGLQNAQLGVDGSFGHKSINFLRSTSQSVPKLRGDPDMPTRNPINERIIASIKVDYKIIDNLDLPNSDIHSNMGKLVFLGQFVEKLFLKRYLFHYYKQCSIDWLSQNSVVFGLPEYSLPYKIKDYHDEFAKYKESSMGQLSELLINHGNLNEDEKIRIIELVKRRNFFIH